MTQRTHLAFHYDSHLSTLQVTVIAVKPVTSLEENDRVLFKQARDDDHVVITDSTIFHPQGGGQPSDIGVMEVSNYQLLGVNFLPSMSCEKPAGSRDFVKPYSFEQY